MIVGNAAFVLFCQLIGALAGMLIGIIVALIWLFSHGWKS